ncbi:MAG TPA: sigma-70 family RNA polymerase sigma factor, partial [Pyrinomonadaceae bacterium]
MSHSESELVGRARGGDIEAFCSLARLYERRVYVLALHYCRNAHDAEDLSQEVWLKAYKGLASFREESSFYTWLRQIMINSFLNHQRGVVRRLGDYAKGGGRLVALDDAEESAGLPAQSASETEDSLHRKILVERVMGALEELTAQQRLIFLLKHNEGMTYEEIAGSLGCSAGTIKKSLFRAVAKLRQHLGVEAE